MPQITDAIDEMLELAADPRRAEGIAAMRARFEERTGAFADPAPARRADGPAPARGADGHEALFEARSAAFWDDALTRGAFGRELLSELSEASRGAVEPLARAQRGLFRVERHGGETLLVDEWSGAEWIVLPAAPGVHDALERATSLLDGRVVGYAGSVILLGGAIFHAADALGPIRALIPEARKSGLGTHDFLDALLRMDHALRSLSRVKAAFAYRKEALPP